MNLQFNCIYLLMDYCKFFMGLVYKLTILDTKSGNLLVFNNPDLNVGVVGCSQFKGFIPSN